jgi:hypothetical protein
MEKGGGEVDQCGSHVVGVLCREMTLNLITISSQSLSTLYGFITSNQVVSLF